MDPPLPDRLYSTVGYGAPCRAVGERPARRAVAPYAQLLAEQVLEPLGMASTGFAAERTLAARLVTAHRDGQPVDSSPTTPTLSAPGGLYATVADLLRLVQANLLDATATPDLARPLALVLEPTPVRSFPGLDRHARLAHFEPLGLQWDAGFNQGHSAFVAFDRRSGRGVVLLANAGLDPADARLAIAGLRDPRRPPCAEGLIGVQRVRSGGPDMVQQRVPCLGFPCEQSGSPRAAAHERPRSRRTWLLRAQRRLERPRDRTRQHDTLHFNKI